MALSLARGARAPRAITALHRPVLVGADLDNPPLRHDGDLVGIAHGGEAMGDRDRRAAGGEGVQGAL